MAIALICSRCSKRYDLDDSLAGKRVRCKECAQVMRVPTEVPATSEEGYRPPPAAEVPKTLKGAYRPPPPVDDDDDRPPARSAPLRPTSSRPTPKRLKPQADLPPLVMAGLGLIAVLLVGATLFAVGLALARGRPDLAGLPLALLVAFVCAGAGVVSSLKLLFLMSRTSSLDRLACTIGLSIIALGALRIPLFGGKPNALNGLASLPYSAYVLYFVVRHWEDTWRLFCVNMAAVAGLILWSIFVPPYLTNSGRPGAAGSGFAQTGADQNMVEVIVTGVSSGGGSSVIGDKLRALLDHGGGYSAQSMPGDVFQYSVWPVRDPQAFADQITFGKVTELTGRRIVLVADPVSAEEIAAIKPREAPKPIARVPEAARVETKAEPEAERPVEPQPPAGADAITRALFGLKSSNNDKQKQAVQQLARMTPRNERRDEVQEGLRPLLDHHDTFLVHDVIKTMASWLTPETVPALIPKTTDHRFDVRWLALETLGKLRDPRAAEAIAARLKDDGIKSEPALRELGPAAEPAVIALLRSPDADVRRKACTVLKDIGGRETLTFMSKARPDPDTGVRMAAQEAMAAIAGRVGPLPKPAKAGR